VEAVRNGKFHIYSVETIEEGIEVLTGKEAGVLEENGTYSEGSIFDLVQKKLMKYSQIVEDHNENN